MKGKITLLIVILLVSLGREVSAQYEDMLSPQPAKDMARLKLKKVKSQIIYINGGQTPYGMNTFDTAGRLVHAVNPKVHDYYRYDAEGKLLSWIDSSSDGRRFWKSEYSFTYGPDGRLASVKTPNYTSKLQFNAESNELTEDITTANKSKSKKTYRYNEDGKLGYEEERSASGEVIMRRKLIYNKYGDLASEIDIKFTDKGEKDSITIINTYDSKGRLVRRQTTRTLLVEGPAMIASDESAAVPETDLAGSGNGSSVINSRNDVNNFTYDRFDNVLTEILTSSDSKESYKKEWIYNMDGLAERYNRYDLTGKILESYSYKYK